MQRLGRYIARSTRYPRSFFADRSYRAGNVIALLALLYAALERLWFGQLSPIFPRANEVGSLLSDVAIGYIAAWILLYLVTWRPAYLSRHRAAPIVAKQVFRMFAHASQLKGVLREAAGSSESDPLTRHELHEICTKLTFRQPSNMSQIGNPANRASVLAAIAHTCARVSKSPHG